MCGLAADRGGTACSHEAALLQDPINSGSCQTFSAGSTCRVARRHGADLRGTPHRRVTRCGATQWVVRTALP